MEDVEQDLPGDVDQAGVVETLPGLGEGDLGLANTELDEVAVEQEQSAQQSSETGQLQEVEQTAWTERGQREVRDHSLV